MNSNNISGDPEKHSPCNSCGEKLGESMLFCPYCGAENKNFSLEIFNKIQQFWFEDFVAFTSTEQVKNCSLYDPGHVDIKGYKLPIEPGEILPKFCYHCGKSV